MRALFKISFLVLMAVVAGLAASAAEAASVWREPACAPTGCNAEAPINTGADDQAKLGGLSIGKNFAVAGVSKLLGKVGVGSSVDPSEQFEVRALGTPANAIASIFGGDGATLSNRATLKFKTIGGGGGTVVSQIYQAFGINGNNNYNLFINPYGDTLFENGRVAIGTYTPAANLKLDVEGLVGAAGYCDSDGQNCKTIAELAAGAGTGSGGGTGGGNAGPNYWSLSSGGDLRNNAGERTTIQGNFYVNGSFADLGAAAQVNSLTTNSLKLNGVTRSSWPLANCRKVTNSQSSGGAWKAVACNAGEIAISGGGFCGGGSDRLAASEPLAPGASQSSDAYIDGNLWGWAIKCIASQGNYERNVFAICCGL